MLEEKSSDVLESSDKEDRRVVMLKDVTARLERIILIIILVIIISVLTTLVNIIYVYIISRWENGEVEATLTKISLEVAL